MLHLINIDGSHGEGGGQILRTAIALSALSMTAVCITNIRAGRPKPGLQKQHIAGIELVSQLVGAEVRGLEVGRTELEFKPHERVGGHFKYDVGTAGSISLVLQAVLPAAVLSSAPVRFTITGGTDVKWSPPIDYLSAVFATWLRRMGPIIDIKTIRRGHYPKGGGRVFCEVTPVDKIRPIEMVRFGKVKQVAGVSHCVRLPAHVAERQAAAASEILKGSSIDQVIIKRESYSAKSDPHIGPGSGIVLWAESELGNRIGTDELGERGVRAEEVGEKCAKRLVKEVGTGMATDTHMADMLVPYLALADGESKIGITQVSEHLRTNLWVAKQILSSEMDFKENLDGTGLLVVRGAGFSSKQ